MLLGVEPDGGRLVRVSIAAGDAPAGFLEGIGLVLDGDHIGEGNPNDDGGDQVPKDREQENEPHQARGFPGQARGALEEAPVDDLQADMQQDSPEDGQGNLRGEGAGPQGDDQ